MTVTAARFRKKPTTIAVVRWTGHNLTELQEWTEHDGLHGFFFEDGEAEVWNEIHQNWLPVQKGECVVKGQTHGDYYPIAYETLMDPEQYEPCSI